MKIVIAGGSGFLGEEIRRAFAGHDLTILSRRPAKTPEAIGWGPAHGEGWKKRVGDADAVVNLAGENIGASRWTETRKKELLDSRIESTSRLVEALAAAPPRQRVLVNASAVGYYGMNRGDEVLTEDSAPGDDFLARLCLRWEAEARKAEPFARVALLRFGVILGRDGGLLQRLIPLFNFFAGGKVGSGKQWLAWIDRPDAAAMVRWAVETPEVAGAYNATAPAPVTNAALTRELAAALGRPALAPAPAFMLRAVFGEMADGLLLASQRAEPRRAVAEGFKFRQPRLDGALRRALAE